MRRENWEEKKERKRLSKPSCGYAADTCRHGREQLQSEFQQHQEKPSSELVRPYTPPKHDYFPHILAHELHMLNIF